MFAARCLQPIPRQPLNRPTWPLSPPVTLGHREKQSKQGLLQHKEEDGITRTAHGSGQLSRCYLGTNCWRETVSISQTVKQRQRRETGLHRGPGFHLTSCPYDSHQASSAPARGHRSSQGLHNPEGLSELLVMASRKETSRDKVSLYREQEKGRNKEGGMWQRLEH